MGGERLAAFEDVVVVAINYRLGPLGFLCLDTEVSPLLFLLSSSSPSFSSSSSFSSPSRSPPATWVCWTWWWGWNGSSDISATSGATQTGAKSLLVDVLYTFYLTIVNQLAKLIYIHNRTGVVSKLCAPQSDLIPPRVTLFGDSAGAASAGHLMLSQEANGLFHQVPLRTLLDPLKPNLDPS